MSQDNRSKSSNEVSRQSGTQRKATQHSNHPETHKPGMGDDDGQPPIKRSKGSEVDARSKHDPDGNEEQQTQ
jgi:hypothetical protein